MDFYQNCMAVQPLTSSLSIEWDFKIMIMSKDGLRGAEVNQDEFYLEHEFCPFI